MVLNTSITNRFSFYFVWFSTISFENIFELKTRYDCYMIFASSYDSGNSPYFSAARLSGVYYVTHFFQNRFPRAQSFREIVFACLTRRWTANSRNTKDSFPYEQRETPENIDGRGTEHFYRDRRRGSTCLRTGHRFHRIISRRAPRVSTDTAPDRIECYAQRA